VAMNRSSIDGPRPGVTRHTPAMNTHDVMVRRRSRSPFAYCRNGLLPGALRAHSCLVIGVFAGEAGLIGACAAFSGTLLLLRGFRAGWALSGRQGIKVIVV